jgi:hypothetical protein
MGVLGFFWHVRATSMNVLREEFDVSSLE